MTVNGYFTPFIDVKQIVSSSAFIKSGSDTSDTDAYRQGVEITTLEHRSIGTIPRLSTGDDNNEHELFDFGQANTFVISAPFTDRTTVNFGALASGSFVLSYPPMLRSDSIDDFSAVGGYIRPLHVETADLISSSFYFEPHDIRSSIMGGRAGVIKTLIDLKESTQQLALFKDKSDREGVMTGSILLQKPEYVAQKSIRPFDESYYLSKSVVSGSHIASASYDVINALVSMTSSMTDEYVPAGYRSAAKGFVYSDSIMGTDSIAFGGLKRS